MDERNQNEKTKISFRCSQFQKDTWQSEADILNISLSEYLMKKIDSPFSPVDDAQINEIKASQINCEYLIFEIEQCCQESGTFTKEQFDKIMDALKSTSDRIDELFYPISEKINADQNGRRKINDNPDDEVNETEEKSNKKFNPFDDDDDDFWNFTKSENENEESQEKKKSIDELVNKYFPDEDDGNWF